MSQQASYIESKSATEGIITPIDDFSFILEKYNLQYKEVGCYFQVKGIPKKQGWMLHISVVRWQILELLEKLMPLLKSLNIPFKIIKDKETARNILDGNLGNNQ